MSFCELFIVFILIYSDVSSGQNGKPAARGSCEQPQPVANAVLRSPFRNKETFNASEVVEYDCAIGYSITGRSRERKCDNGRWSSVKFSCDLITCPYVPPPEHGRRLDWNNGAGEYTEFGCNTGYEMKGPKKILCRTDGKWRPTRPPTCEPILCPELYNIRNGKGLFQDTSGGIRNDYESVTEYTCKRGFYLNGDTKMKVYKRTCQADGTWDGERPTCDVPRCKQIPDFYNGTIRYFGDRKLYSQAFFRCVDAFSLFPKDVDMSECEDTLTWKPDPPKCYRNVEMKIPDNGYAISGGQRILLHTESYNVCCNKDYELKTDSKIGGKCMKERIQNYKGKLVPNVPECIEERCDPADLTDAVVKYNNSETVKTKILSRTKVYLSCRDGYDYYYSNGRPMTKPVERECIKGIIKYAPQCEKKKCLLSGYQKNADTIYKYGHRVVSADQYINHGRKVRVYCQKENEYELFVDSTQTYLEKNFSTECRYGQFDERKNDFPICLERRCDVADLKDAVVKYNNSETVKTKIPSRTKVYLSCRDGYDYYNSNGRPMTKPVKRECIKGIIKNAPQCENKKCLLSGYPNNTNTFYKIGHRVVFAGQYIDHESKVRVSCRKENEYELFVNSTQTYVEEEFSTECRQGQFDMRKNDFPICLEKRCSFDVSNDGACLSTNGDDVCKHYKFKIKSGSIVQLTCENGYKLYRSNGKRSVEDTENQTLFRCNKGNYFKGYKCIPDGYLNKLKHLAKYSARTISRFTCRFSIFGFETCKDPCLIPEIPFGYVKHDMDKIEVEADDGTTISVECYDGYTPSKQMTTTCKNGEWDYKLLPKCNPNPCNLTLHEGMSFWTSSRLLTGNSGTKQTFDNGTKLKMQCDKGYRMKDMISQIPNRIKYSTCKLGNWTHRYECIPDECSVPKVSHAKLRGKDASQYKHREKITFICDDGFNFDQNVSTKVSRFETTCNLGNWTDGIPQECKKDGCRLDMHEGSYYYEANTNESITSVKLIEHLADIQLQCMDTYDLFNDKNEIFLDKDYKPTVTCYRGKWRNAYFCKKRCVLDNITNGRFMTETVNLTAGDTIKHGESVKVECDDENSDSNLSIECNGGAWKSEIGCYVASSSSTTIKSTETTAEIADSTHESYDYDYQYESQSADNFPIDSQSESKKDKGCTLSKDRRYMYKDREGKKIKPGSIINDSTTLNVTCTIIDLEDYYNSFVYDDEHNTDLASFPTITCANNTLSQIELDCPVVTGEAETCLELKHGNVIKENGYYMVSCDKGFSLNLTIPEDPKCTCKNGTLKSVYGDQIPHCIPDNCKIPYEIDGRLSVTYRNSVSLSGGSVIEVGDFVYLNCSKADGPNYEPLNRRFTCSNGMLTEAESDGNNWKLGYDGEFPKCRAAKCEPNCTNGGVCYKDYKCRCQHFTEGKRCENVICDKKCYKNGGKCVGPDKCECPQGRFGKNCDQEGCLLPEDAAKYKNSRTKFSPGETIREFSCPAGFILSTLDGMTCQDGVWSNYVTCVKAAVYLISVKTGTKLNSGTNAKVYITLHGLRGSTHRIYLKGSFEADTLDETREPAKDIRPITSVVIGHDGSGFAPGWYLEYVSIYVENMEEYYVFKHNDWLAEEKEVRLPRQGIDQQRCIASFDSGNSWWPKWRSIKEKDMHYFKNRRGTSLRGCKQACIDLQKMACVAVTYDKGNKTCWGFAVSDRKYFNVKYGRWNSPVYIRKCLHFDRKQ